MLIPGGPYHISAKQSVGWLVDIPLLQLLCFPSLLLRCRVLLLPLPCTRAHLHLPRLSTDSMPLALRLYGDITSLLAASYD